MKNKVNLDTESRWSGADTIRLEHLVDNIRRILAMLKDYEDELLHEDDPRRKAKYRRSIEELRTSAIQYQQEYDELRSKISEKPSPQLQEVDAQLNEMDNKLNMLLEGQNSIREDMTSLRQAILGHFDASQKGIINDIAKRLEQSQLANTQKLLEAVENGHVRESELQETLNLVRQAISEIQQAKMVTPDHNFVSEVKRISDVFDDPMLEVKNKLKLTIPIIPFLLSYEGEIESKIGLNLQAVWSRLVDNVRSRFR